MSSAIASRGLIKRVAALVCIFGLIELYIFWCFNEKITGIIPHHRNSAQLLGSKGRLVDSTYKSVNFTEQISRKEGGLEIVAKTRASAPVVNHSSNLNERPQIGGSGTRNKYKDNTYRSYSDRAPPPDSKQPDVPGLWDIPPNIASDLDSIGSHVEGEPTIFVGIASYRDERCHSTIERAFQWADHRSRLSFGVVDQSAPEEGDILCNFTQTPCTKDPTQLLCVYSAQIRFFHVHASVSLGPTFGRHRADRLYRGEYFALQIDAHTHFARGWDTKLIEQWRLTGNEYAVLTVYPLDYVGELDKNYDPVHRWVPLMCGAYFKGGSSMVTHKAAPAKFPNDAIVGRTPILHTQWGAGMSFARGHRLVRVPYDCCLPMIFDGEEFSMEVRMWTHGYDFYSPHPAVIYHDYHPPRTQRRYWENAARIPKDTLERSERRIRALFGMNESSADYDSTEIHVGGRYGLGTRRPLQAFFDLFGFDLKKRLVRSSCSWVQSQKMHQELVQFLRDDKKGIDYSRVPVERMVKQYLGNSPWLNKPNLLKEEE